MKNKRATPEPSRGTMLFACMLFFGSGALALGYELAWVRLIALHLGSESLALTLVLCVFMGGLALGAWVGGRWVDRWRNPLTRYGYAELIIAVYAGLSPLFFP